MYSVRLNLVLKRPNFTEIYCINISLGLSKFNKSLFKSYIILKRNMPGQNWSQTLRRDFSIRASSQVTGIKRLYNITRRMSRLDSFKAYYDQGCAKSV